MLKDNYNLIEKSLHYLILNNKFVSELLFDLDKFFYLKDIELQSNKHLFISGLARSGSTILLNIIYQNNKYCSFTYNDMPMILAPNIWSKITGKAYKNTKLKNRAHQDSIKININSPESFDEIFWKLIKNNNFVTKNKLIKLDYTKNDLNEYSNLISLICAKNHKKNYLSKNNNSILRLEEILGFFKNSFFLIPFRDPYNHSNSLLNQHIKFIKLQKNNKFVRKYMDWLGHHEFGLGHKNFKFNDQNENIISDTNSIDYWIKLWINFYEYILLLTSKSNYNKRIVFVNYDELCNNKKNYLDKIYDLVKLDKFDDHIKMIRPKNYQIIKHDKKLLEKAYKIYSDLSK